MSNIQNTLESLQPYVIGIRYLKGTPLVDVVLTEGWTLPEDSKITKVKGDESMNYHMIFSETSGIGLDELLAYVDRTIKINLEREKKHELLKLKVNQLKELFKKTTLSKLEKLKFTFGDEDFITNMTDIDYDEPIPSTNTSEPTKLPYDEEIIDKPFVEPVTQSTEYLNEDGKPIEMSEEDIELAAEEARAERNLRILDTRKQKSTSIAKKIELPPKRKVAMANDINYDTDCDCSETEACEKCIDKKDF